MSKKRYRMNAVGNNGNTVTVAIPPVVIERNASLAGVTTQEFIKKYNAVAVYDIDGKFSYIFEVRKDGESHDDKEVV